MLMIRFQRIGRTNDPAFSIVVLEKERAAKAGLADNSVETQAAASFSTWQVLEAAVTATNGLDDKAMAQWLKKNRVDTIQGRLRFDIDGEVPAKFIEPVASEAERRYRSSPASRKEAIPPCAWRV